MAIDFNVPQSLLQYKGYDRVVLTGEKKFIFNFEKYDSRIHILRVLQNGKILPSSEYVISSTDTTIQITLNTYARSNDIIHLDVFIPLTRDTEYSICTIDYEINCNESVNSYPLEFEYFDEISCKLQIFHSRIGFISKERYEVNNNNIIFNDISFMNGDILYVKVIQDGAILLQ